jgi:hypothetical protein
MNKILNEIELKNFVEDTKLFLKKLNVSRAEKELIISKILEEINLEKEKEKSEKILRDAFGGLGGLAK